MDNAVKVVNGYEIQRMKPGLYKVSVQEDVQCKDYIFSSINAAEDCIKRGLLDASGQGENEE